MLDVHSNRARSAFVLLTALMVFGLTLMAPGSVRAATCASISQFGVTFTFDTVYECGQFVNGDHWVAPQVSGGDVRITAISPDAGGGRHGWMVNPSQDAQAFDDRLSSWRADLLPSLPLDVRGISSVVKGVSEPLDCGTAGTDHLPCLTTAVVLTVLDTPPANAGSNTFRPPYFGDHKPLFDTAALRMDLLPSVPEVPGAPTLERVERRYQRVQLDHLTSWRGRYMHASNNFRFSEGGTVSEYGAEIARDYANAALRMMLDDVTAPDHPALVNVLQAGIDAYGIRRGGMWIANGGHGVGRKLMVGFAAAMFDDADMTATAQLMFDEDEILYRSSLNSLVLYGRPCAAGVYERVRTGGSGERDCRDPFGYIDGGEEAGGTYQFCCTTMPMLGTSTAARYMPALRSALGGTLIHEYIDRWMSLGTWALPDPYNRFPERHGTHVGGGSYGTTFQTNMWTSRPASPDPDPDPDPTPDPDPDPNPDASPDPDPDATPEPDPTPDPTVDSTDPAPRKARTMLAMRTIGPRRAMYRAVCAKRGVRCPTFRVKLGAPAARRRVQLVVQRRRSGRWMQVQRVRTVTSRTGWARARFRYGRSHPVSGRYRVRWIYAGNARYAPRRSAWRPFSLTR